MVAWTPTRDPIPSNFVTVALATQQPRAGVRARAQVRPPLTLARSPCVDTSVGRSARSGALRVGLTRREKAA